jgi:hypothetical protein
VLIKSSIFYKINPYPQLPSYRLCDTLESVAIFSKQKEKVEGQMDLVSHSSPQHSSPQAAAPAPATQNHINRQPPAQRRKPGGRLMRILSVIVLVLAALIIGLIALYLAIGGSNEESKYVDEKKFQAIFLNGGQVYFGKIHSLNSKFITIDNIYYLRVNQQVQPDQKAAADSAANQDVSLAKLGCELHGPTDVMVINRDQVLFWENLKDDGQVAKAITAYVKENPNGQKCNTDTDTTKK